MRPPSVLPILEGFGGTCGFEQSVAQPRCIAPLKIEGLAEYPGLIATESVRLLSVASVHFGAGPHIKHATRWSSPELK